MSIAQNIKERRLQLKMSQQLLADKLGYTSRSTIAKIESGENTPPNSKIADFARALRTTEDYILTGFEFSVSPEISRNSATKNIAVILAGGTSTRNLQNIPNQFINVLGKPVIIYVLQTYQRHPAIDDIYVVCLDGWDEIVASYATQYRISKLKGIIPGGKTGVMSARNAINKLKCNNGDIIIFQESTRPLITEEIISKLLHSIDNSAIICEPMDEYVQFLKDDIGNIDYIDRNKLYSIQSPEAYKYSFIKQAFKEAVEEKLLFGETSCAMMLYNLGYGLNFIEGNHNNLKIVRQEDITILTALLKNQ